MLLTIRYPSYQSYDKYCQTKTLRIQQDAFFFLIYTCSL
ncbi:hypothetical protein EUBDOL_01785 [Amedibacillus dolichus DSM 3991]|uniref:Uncharacterized protein n=1 Tax=Amedibacillus dolichus DSM 3991 TaxID=428127 RepID=A8REG2_9FIRM|nr:hypothetical protein EUBDOL_01785 [Amedibacillus dolichus DSM 3991]